MLNSTQMDPTSLPGLSSFFPSLDVVTYQIGTTGQPLSQNNTLLHKCHATCHNRSTVVPILPLHQKTNDLSPTAYKSCPLSTCFSPHSNLSSILGPYPNSQNRETTHLKMNQNDEISALFSSLALSSASSSRRIPLP